MTGLPLVERRCVPCEAGAQPLPQTEEAALLEQVPGWRVEEADGHRPDPRVTMGGVRSAVQL